MNERKKPVATKRLIDGFHQHFERFLLHHSSLMHWYYSFNKKMTLEEFGMADLADHASCLYIGSGSFPWTLLILGKETTWKLVGIDRDEGAVTKGQKLIKQFQLSETVTITQGNGLRYEISSFDLIALAHGVNPQTILLDRIAAEMKPQAKILFRGTWAPLNKFYGEEQIPSTLRISNRYHRLDGVKSYLLEKNENDL